ncbi:MAG: tetratricopeptide repeat protein, partial [Sedimenticola sp.]|nr:tetratricopeptide repeat protein [Sedimenticola sp.]
YEPASAVPLTPLHSSAVQSLLRSAEAQERNRDLAGAVGTLERALRIEPRNAHLWHRLATLRFQQGRYSQATGLAEKSLALAGGDRGLKRENWRLIADSKRASGDEAGARVAERKARLVR